MSAALLHFFASHYAFSGAGSYEPVQKKTGKLSGGQRFLPLLAGSGAILLIFPVMIHGMLKDGTTNWLPTFMSEFLQFRPVWQL